MFKSRACAPVLAALSACILFVLPARANTLAGDSLDVSLVCYGNPACSAYSQSSPLVQSLGTLAVPATGDSTITFTSNGAFSSTITGSFSANATQFIMTMSDPAGAGFVGYLVDIPLFGGAFDHIPIVDVNAGTSDGFQLSDASYFLGTTQLPLSDLDIADEPIAGFNFGGLPDLGTAIIDIGSPTEVTPEPSPALLVLTGMLGLAGLEALRRRKAA